MYGDTNNQPARTRHAILDDSLLWWHDFIVNISYDLISLINKDYIYEAASQAYFDAQDHRPSEIVGKSVADLWGEKVFNMVIKGHLDNAFAGKTERYTASFEFGHLGKKTFAVTVYPYTNNGVISHVVVVSREIPSKSE